MTTPASLWKIGSYWALMLGCPIEALSEPAVTILPHDRLSGWQGAFFFQHGPACVISLPASMEAQIRAAIAGAAPHDVFSLDCAAALFGNSSERLIGPAWLGYADAQDYRPMPSDETRMLRPRDAPALRDLASASGEEWEYSGISFESSVVIGRFVDGILVAAGTVERTSRDLLNVGIITHPAYRGRGYGTEIVGALTSYGLRRGAVMQYRTLESNVPSMRIAATLGYQSYGRTIAVRLKPERDDPSA